MVEKFMVEYSGVGKLRVWYILQPINKAFRKKSLSCHPDKHPNDPNAVDIFVQLCQAQTVLLEKFEAQNNSIFDDLFDEQKSTFAPQWTSNSTSQSQNARVRIWITVN